MESILEYLPIILFAIYALLRNRKAAQRKRAQKAELDPATEQPKSRNPLQEFLRQLEEAAAEANGETQPRTLEIPVTSAPRKKRSALEVNAPMGGMRDVEFHEVPGAGFDHEQHGFGPENPLSEPVFSNRPAMTPRLQRQSSKPFDPHHLTDTPLQLPRTTAPRRAAVLAERLRHPDAARDAIVLNAIFQRPGARTERHR